MKKIVLVLGVLLAGLTTKAQDYYHGAGLQANYAIYSYGGSSSAIFVPGIFYKASLAFEINRDMSFAVSAYPFLGMKGSFNSQSGGSSNLALGAELPVLGELYFGDLDDNCFFVGAGVYAGALINGGGNVSIVGPQIDLGGQFEFRDKLTGVKAAFAYGMNKGGLEGVSKNIFSLGVYLVF